MLKFKIQINNGVLVDINTPIDFEKTDFNLTRSKDYHSVTSSFAGNKASFVFQKDVHNNIFDDLINEYETKGFNADVKMFIYWNNTLVFDGIFDFIESETDLVNTIKCQVVKKDKLFYLDKNKSVDVDVFSTKDLNDVTTDAVNTQGLRLSSVSLFRHSRWEDNVNTYVMNDSFNTAFNNIRTQKTDEIPNSLNWLEIANNFNDTHGITHKLIEAKENLSNINVSVFYSADSTIRALNIAKNAKLYLAWGHAKYVNTDDWFNNVNKILIKNFDLVPNVETPIDINFTTTINSIEVGDDSGIWLFWEVEGRSVSTTDGTVFMQNKNSYIDITAETKTYPSYLDSVKYEDLIKNIVKKTADINNVRFNVNWYNGTYVFNSNLLRRLTNKSMVTKWDDVKKQLNERNLGCYYEESTDTLVFDHRSSILGYNKIQNVGDLAKLGEFNVSEDDSYVINQFGYKYNKYQALKENAIEGNNATIHGESEWFVNNKGYEGKIQVDLPYFRDNFMIEDLRRQSLIYKEDTSTSDSDDIMLIETNPITSLTILSENFYVNCSFADGQQTFINDGSFSWRRVLGDNIEISVNNSTFLYYIISISDTTLILGKASSITQELNGLLNINIRWRFLAGVISKVTNGLLNADFSIRQNIEYWKQTLQATNFYNSIPIRNSLYKENKTEVINGLTEVADIITAGGMNTPRYIENKVVISVADYFNLSNNKIGYISIYNSRSEQVNIYLDELNATFIDGCERMEAALKGWLKIPISQDYDRLVTIKNQVNDMIVSGLNFRFYDDIEKIDYLDRFGAVIYEKVDFFLVVRPPSNWFTDYQNAKNYLLSL